MVCRRIQKEKRACGHRNGRRRQNRTASRPTAIKKFSPEQKQKQHLGDKREEEEEDFFAFRVCKMTYYNPTPLEADAYKQLFEVASKGQSSSIGGAEAVKFFVASGTCTHSYEYGYTYGGECLLLLTIVKS